jgi:hypothetical protein
LVEVSTLSRLLPVPVLPSSQVPLMEHVPPPVLEAELAVELELVELVLE